MKRTLALIIARKHLAQAAAKPDLQPNDVQLIKALNSVYHERPCIRRLVQLEAEVILSPWREEEAP